MSCQKCSQLNSIICDECRPAQGLPSTLGDLAGTRFLGSTKEVPEVRIAAALERIAAALEKKFGAP